MEIKRFRFCCKHFILGFVVLIMEWFSILYEELPTEVSYDLYAISMMYVNTDP